MPERKNSSIITSINSEIGQSHLLRIPLLKSIGKHFQGTVISFFATHRHWQGSLNDNDAAMLKDLLASIGRISNLLLIIDSPGGDPLSAERIVKICREYASGDFITLVPDKAKSAATMVCLGSDKIILMPESELGPIDVQIPWGNNLLSAQVVIKSYEELMEKCTHTPPDQRVEPFLQQLQAYNAAQVEQLRLHRDLAKEIAEKVLRDGMLKKIGKDIQPEILNHFLNPDTLKSHGRPIFYSDIKKVDAEEILNVECLNHDSPIFLKVHEYLRRAVSNMDVNKYAKLFESVQTSFATPIIGG